MDEAFPTSNGKPILISESRTDTVCTMRAGMKYVPRTFAKFTALKKILIGTSKITKDNCDYFINNLLKISTFPKVLVIGGGETGSGTEALWQNKEIEIHSVDIYQSDSVDVICDGHYLPLVSDFYDGVWIQAVLEHVVEPQVVVAEIHRVLKLGGIVYAETPFMQHVHEGAYDFTRFTVLGHRYLFRKFDLIKIGGIKGPEVVLGWSINYFVWALFRSRNIARVAGIIAGFLLRPFSKIITNKSLYDASSGVYFMGAKSDNVVLRHKDLISLYKGQFKS